jgi:hypothetical protein
LTGATILETMRALRAVGLVGMVLCGVAIAAHAHHSTTVFDSSRTLTVTGIVAKLEWTNPHVFVWVNVPTASDQTRHDVYAFENASPNVLELAGWNRTILKAGDKITVDYSPLRDGKNGGLWILGRLTDGRVLSSRPVSRNGRPAQVAAQAASAGCPRAEVVEVMPKASTDTRPVNYQNGTIQVSRTPISTLKDIVSVGYNEPMAIQLAFTPEVGERMEQTTARPNFPMAFVVDNDVVLSVVLQGGFGIGKDGLQITVDRNEERIRKVYDALRRCVAARNAK